MAVEIRHGECLDVMRSMDTGSVDLVVCSPPYEDARTYGIGYNMAGQAWVDWCVPRFVECLRVCRGLVAWVVEGRTKSFQWTATPALLMADLHRAGVKLRKPPIYARVGIPGSGGPDWWRNDYEFVVCASHGKLPWSDNTATGHPPKFGVGGAMSNRTEDGRRRNAKTGARRTDGRYKIPAKANPGNIIKCQVGGGRMGSPLAHENEAPYAESLVEPFVLSFCPPGGVVLDPFCGSGTTGAVAIRHGRRFIGIDVRESQVALSRRRVTDNLFTAEAAS